MEQGSYLLIERGMAVKGTDGELGTVSELVADPEVDVFRGILVSHGLLLPKQLFIPAAYVVQVAERTVQVNLSKAEADALTPPVTGLPGR